MRIRDIIGDLICVLGLFALLYAGLLFSYAIGV
jgi:hypothetical protein